MADRLEKAKAIVQELRARPENQAVDSMWYCVAASAFTASNFGLGVTEVWKAAVEGKSPEEARVVFRRLKEALLKICCLVGIPRTLNAFYPLAQAIPGDEYIDYTNVRENVKNPFDMADRGMKLFRNIYRDETDKYLEPYKIAPDLSQYPHVKQLMVEDVGVIIEYGMYMSEFSILGPVETSQVVVAALIPQDVPVQVKWHMRGLLRNGGKPEDIKYLRDITEKICKGMGVDFKNELPPIPDMSEV